MTIPSNHEIGDEVWFLSSADVKIKIRKGTILRPKHIYNNKEINWEIECTTARWDTFKTEAFDDVCFKTKEELITFLTEE
jgi:hypothetical protein